MVDHPEAKAASEFPDFFFFFLKVLSGSVWVGIGNKVWVGLWPFPTTSAFNNTNGHKRSYHPRQTLGIQQSHPITADNTAWTNHKFMTTMAFGKTINVWCHPWFSRRLTNYLGRLYQYTQTTYGHVLLKLICFAFNRTPHPQKIKTEAVHRWKYIDNSVFGMSL